MTLEEFVALAKIELEAMAASTREQHTRYPDEFPLERDEDAWWREMRAYRAYVQLAVADERRI